MNLVVNEFTKVSKSKVVLFLWIGLLVFNGFLLYINEKEKNDVFEPAFYRKLYQTLENLSNEVAYEKLNQELEELHVLMELTLQEESTGDLQERYPNVSLDEIISRFQQGDYLRYSTSLWKEMALYQQVLAETKQVIHYDDFLQEIEERANTLTSVSIFSEPNTFSYRNIVKTPRDFEHLHGKELHIGPSLGINMATQFLGTDLLAALFLLGITIRLMTREKERGTLNLIKTTYKGRGTLFATKFVVVMIWSLILLVSLYAINFFLAYKMYGFGDLNRLLQSVHGYGGSSLAITVGEYLLFFLFAKGLVYVFLSLTFLVITVIAKNSVAVYVITASILGGSGIVYTMIPPTSIFRFFKYMNLISFMYTYTLFSNYFNLNIFGFPIQYSTCFLIALVIGFPVLFFISYKIFCQQKHGETQAKVSKIFPTNHYKHLGKHTSLFLHELYKLLIVYKVGLVIILVIGFQWFTYQPGHERFLTMDEVYYKQYMLMLEGEKTAEKERFLVEERERYEELQRELEEMLFADADPMSILELSEQLVSYPAFEMVMKQARYLDELERERGIKGWFLYDQGYQQLTAKENNMRDLQLAFLTFIVLIACLTPLFSVEGQTNMLRILLPTRHGRNKLFYTKLFIGFLLSTVLYGIIYIPEFYKILSTYGTRALKAPVASLPHLQYVPWNLTIWQYFCLINVIRFLAIQFASVVIYILSIRWKSIISVTLASTVLIILPLLLSLLGLTLFDYLGLNPFILGNVWFKKYAFSSLQEARFFWSFVGWSAFLVTFSFNIVFLKRQFARGG